MIISSFLKYLTWKGDVELQLINFEFSITDETLKQDIKLSSKDMGNNFVLATQVSKSCYWTFASTNDDDCSNDDVVPRIISHISFSISSKVLLLF